MKFEIKGWDSEKGEKGEIKHGVDIGNVDGDCFRDSVDGGLAAHDAVPEQQANC